MPARTYSNRLGAIDDDQFAAALRRAGLGAFVSAAPVENGLFGQNVFLTATTGEYVFRGAPHWHDGRPDDAWQFPKERLYADLLHARTDAPVAWPQRLDEARDIFPWPYLIAPRLPGLCLADPAARAGLGANDLLAVAEAMGETLARLQAATLEAAGDFDPAAQALAPFPRGYGGHLTDEIARHADAAGRFDAEDLAWLDGLLAADTESPGPACFVHNDYHWGNLLAERTPDGWRISGVRDLMTATFGDPAADFARPCCGWFDSGAAACAPAFLAAYRRAGGTAAPTPGRLGLLTAYERLLIWEYFTRPDAPEPEPLRGRTFRDWAGRYVRRMERAWFDGG
jgi:aminoglycoside phosphotransferase (APT) family kinase protein